MQKWQNIDSRLNWVVVLYFVFEIFQKTETKGKREMREKNTLKEANLWKLG